jgi:transposase
MSEQRTDKSWREFRREQAWVLKQQGWKQKDIAVAMGVSEGAVSQWMVRGRQGELAARPVPGKEPRLSQADKAVLVEIVQAGAGTAGFEGEVWTAGRVGQVIEERFGVRYSQRHVQRLLRQLGLSLQQPVKVASQRNEQAIQAWQAQGWTALKKRPNGKATR